MEGGTVLDEEAYSPGEKGHTAPWGKGAYGPELTKGAHRPGGGGSTQAWEEVAHRPGVKEHTDKEAHRPGPHKLGEWEHTGFAEEALGKTCFLFCVYFFCR
jgi:hypothetical protein